ncbi:MFS transporter [Halorientalis brevis]|uniref:MFS transporter n=1 Tax=Halorientalis brevis TaxID=1126241 RepID=A0ABD6C5W3_9EURY|nr:MFS transporter [Halorientalis brevis]
MTESSAASKYTLWVIVASATLTVMAGAILGPVVPQIQDGLDVSESLAGLVITTHGALIVLTSPVAGAVIDRFGPRRPFIGGLVVYAIGGSAGLVVDTLPPLLVSRAVLGVGTAFVYTGITVLIYDLYEGQRMERALGLRSSANSAGAAVWPLVGGALGTLSWQFPFAIYLIALPLGLLAIATVPETGRGDGGEGQVEANGGSPEPQTDGGLAGVLAVFRRTPALLLVYLLYFGANVFLYGIVVFYPQLLDRIGVTSSFSISLYLAANGAAGGVSAVAYDRLKRRVGGHALVLAAFAFWSLAFGLATVADSPVLAAGPVILFGLGLGLVFPSAFAWVESLAPPDRQGQYSSYVASFGYVGQFLSPLAFGPLVPAVGVRGAFAAAGVTAVVGAVSLGGVLVGRRELRPSEP